MRETNQEKKREENEKEESNRRRQRVNEKCRTVQTVCSNANKTRAT